jgi:hypothetical protein
METRNLPDYPLQQKSAARLVSPWFAAARAPYLAVMTHTNRAAVLRLSLLAAERLV